MTACDKYHQGAPPRLRVLQKFSSPRKNAGGKIVPLPSLTAAYAAPEAIEEITIDPAS